MPALTVPGTPYSIELCQLAEGENGEFPSEIRLLQGGTLHGTYLHRAGATAGYISKVELQQHSRRFVALSIDSGEFCNTLVFFDLKSGIVVAELGCVSPTHLCLVSELDQSSRCTATVRCSDQGGEGAPPTKPAIDRTVNLCANPRH